MRVWSLPVAAICGCCLMGCDNRPPATPINPSAPAVEEANKKVESHAAVTPAKPAEPIAKTLIPTEPPIQPSQDPLREIAARLVEPNDIGGWRISESAALELERLGPDAPAKLLPLMSDAQLEVRRGSAFHLLSCFDPSSPAQVAAFTKALGDQDATIRGIGLQAVKQLPPADIAAAAPQLIAMLDPKLEAKYENRSAIVRLAGSLGPKGSEFIDSLGKSATNDPDERVRSAALFAISQVATPEQSLPTLRQGLADKQPAVRLVAAGRLRNLAAKAEPAAEDLAAALADSDERVRTSAAEALVRIGPSAQAALTKALESKDVNARKLALACLSSLGPAAKSALPAIEKAQTDADKDISEAAKVLAERLKQ
ncbi:HEAT repeat domain-containing protein [Anatilimnocola sp. NA78]|uniref:HEAT repeat domain-containing protein n=1 Tax=Anatilimnocola sp. NA78 TaxID=3415683 RepID=UPI003CE49C78